ncbi:hypothetical protein CL616_01550 [archaeon]|nr:hypothetical protein [archaeon]
MKKKVLFFLLIILLISLVEAEDKYGIIFDENNQPITIEYTDKYQKTDSPSETLQSIDTSSWYPISELDTEELIGILYYLPEDPLSHKGKKGMFFDETLELTSYYLTLQASQDLTDILQLEKDLQIENSEIVSENQEEIILLVIQDSTTYTKIGGNQFTELASPTTFTLDRQGNIKTASILVGEEDGTFLVQSQKYTFPKGTVLSMQGNVITNIEMDEDRAIAHYPKVKNQFSDEPVYILGAEEFNVENEVFKASGTDYTITNANGETLRFSGSTLYNSNNDFFIGEYSSVAMAEETLTLTTGETGTWVTQCNSNRQVSKSFNRFDLCGNTLFAGTTGDTDFSVDYTSPWEEGFLTYTFADTSGQLNLDLERKLATISGTLSEQNGFLVVDYINGKPSIALGDSFGGAQVEGTTNSGNYLVENTLDEETGDIKTEVSKLQKKVPVASTPKLAVAQAGHGESTPDPRPDGIYFSDPKCEVDNEKTAQGSYLIYGIYCTSEVVQVKSGQANLEKKINLIPQEFENLGFNPDQGWEVFKDNQLQTNFLTSKYQELEKTLAPANLDLVKWDVYTDYILAGDIKLEKALAESDDTTDNIIVKDVFNKCFPITISEPQCSLPILQDLDQYGGEQLDSLIAERKREI